jgi:hypothetical protein
LLKRVYIDNFKAMLNFELKLGQLVLLLGSNGCGKTTLADVLSRLRSVVGGVPIEEQFHPTTLTRWESRRVQTFEIDVSGNAGLYEYHLEVEHTDRPQPRIVAEHLRYDQKPLFVARLDDDGVYRARLFRDDHREGPEVLADWSRSGLAQLQSRPENRKLYWFKKWLSELSTVIIDPWGMAGSSEKEEQTLRDDASNFASWYRQMTQEKPARMIHYFDDLKEVLDGFQEVNFVPHGEVFALRVKLNGINHTWKELSEGQRALISLYSLLHFAVDDGRTTVFDEPENFISTREIQPWLVGLCDRIETLEDAQALIISHHPETLNYLAGSSGLLLERKEGGPVRVRKWAEVADSGLEPAEVLARGWEHE